MGESVSHSVRIFGLALSLRLLGLRLGHNHLTDLRGMGFELLATWPHSFSLSFEVRPALLRVSKRTAKEQAEFINERQEIKTKLSQKRMRKLISLNH